MSLARRFNAGTPGTRCLRRVATAENPRFNRRYATPKTELIISPALKRRAKLMPTQRAENQNQTKLTHHPGPTTLKFEL
jgi:hypothetical protein